VLVGDTQGQVTEWRLPGDGRPATRYDAFQAAPEGIAITALSFLLGDATVAVGDAQGRISAWFRAGEGQVRPWVRAHLLQPHRSAVVRIAPSQRDRQFLTADVQGNVALHQPTSERTFFELATGLPGVADLVLGPKADGFAVLGTGGELLVYGLKNPHPEVSSAILFGRVWYEGHPGPSHAWQSTGGSDDFEPKLSLVPLLFGTAKGTLYALLFSLPVAVLAAIYTAEFAGPRVRGVVKPTVEIMASLPSVILGFLAGLWLAPLLARELVGVLLIFPLTPVAVALAAWGWHLLPERFLRRVPRQFELLLLTLVILLSIGLARTLGPVLEALAFPAGFPAWLQRAGGPGYDQRNSLVVGFAMGFAVIPLIFTICEDALAAVPRHLRAGSLALGASRWQTAVRVVLPMALPGIFSAAMIGFGRAIGETMIVLMAAGNTPIMDWSPFNGMRTISANIAVELPEAPYHGTLYRVLFLSGLLLFAATFCINTLAELVRQRLRDRYSRL
jgi:phosphate transport system permease protein